MDKKITSIMILLIIFVSATIAFVSFKQLESTEDQQTYTSEDDDVTYEELSNEIDDAFLSEDDDVVIGDMI